ncbi:PREDICTED: T-lymphocyte surface antigen Ly-9-like isoform X2 [Ficedula albicollis]|uniref:T-lymphocyte surface antigen Ly-9-like isoform X2 n=1 Tax=Ficedula albicollis TaxID=59894 RepID=UPI00035A1754|nr:PREDICTED: T-lymphocyte surface antigen Ly-9-like isoform X2 [Ficedula albicollis]
MPLDKFWISLLTTLMLLHQTMSASDTTELIRAVGESVTFHTHDTTKGNAFWYFGNVPIVAVSFGDPPQALFSTQTLKKRSAVSEKGRALSISQLRLEDAGNYSVKINEKRCSFTLHVYRELTEPTVTCEAQNCSSGGSCHYSLCCSVSGTDLGKVSYIWRVGDWLWDQGLVVLWVNQSSLEELGPLTCTAWNPVSIKSVTITTPDVLCTGSGVTIWLLATIGVAVLLLVLLLFLRKFTASSSTTVYAEVGPSQQRLPNVIKAKPTDGESTTTVYSLVRRPDQVENGTAKNGTVVGLELL